MAGFDINDMRANLPLGGVRSTLFQVQLVNPVDGSMNSLLPFRAVATGIPAATLGTIQVPYYGRMMKLAGDRTFDPWTITIIDDEDFKIRDAMENWNTKINALRQNVRLFNSSASLLYKSTGTVTQFSKTAKPLRTYSMEGAYPASIGPAEVSWGATDQLYQFQCTIQYDWWEPSGVTGNAGNNI